jgi:hypothetical protein
MFNVIYYIILYNIYSDNKILKYLYDIFRFRLFN